MPLKEKHIIQARHDRQFWESHDLDKTPFRDWVVSGIFYEAAHWVEAYLATKGDHPTTHGQRNHAMQRYTDLDSVLVDYDVLKTESENARYNCYIHNADDIRNDLVPILGRIETYVQGLL